jgi:hypothetical protein
MMARSALSLALAALSSLFAGCATPELPEGVGEGLTSFDREPPEGVETFDRPVWKEGDRFVFVRGGILRIAMRVTEASDEEGYVLVDENLGARTLLTPDLAAIGLDVPGQPDAMQRAEPAEPMLHWPLWVGKRWSAHFLRKRVGQPPFALSATYHCDAIETIVVPAGEFRCLRIWRRLRVADTERKFLERAFVMWYSPEVGYFVRRLEDGSLMELESFHRQR